MNEYGDFASSKGFDVEVFFGFWDHQVKNYYQIMRINSNIRPEEVDKACLRVGGFPPIGKMTLAGISHLHSTLNMQGSMAVKPSG